MRKNKQTKYSFVLALTFVFVAAPLNVFKANAQYYPNAEPSAWYILPGQPLSFSGTDFAPFERVRIQGPDSNSSLTTFADGAGNLDSPVVLNIPHSWQNSTRDFTVIGGESDWPTQIEITVGTFYPQITPSKWWVRHGNTLTVTGKNFSPNETVRLYMNGIQTAQSIASSRGTVSFFVTVPAKGVRATVSARGQSSGLTNSKNIYLY